MKKYLLLLLAFASGVTAIAQTGSFLPGYNSMFYPDVLSAAKGVAMPFLLRQGYFTMHGVTVADSVITYQDTNYAVHQDYLNPTTGYYVSSSQYSSYGITGFSNIWPHQFPNILYKSSDTSFNAQSDCVGYLTRLLSATGDTSVTGNGYRDIISITHAANTVPFAYTGYVATAYSFAVAFPTFPTTVNFGWQYIAGNVEPDTIDIYNHSQVSGLGTYNGVRKGGFGQSLPGDILAFGYSPSSSSNGHIMVMETSPQLLTVDSLGIYFPSQTIAQATALLSTYNMYGVRVFDCSGQMAHFEDSRTSVSGIGHGTLLLLTAKTDDAPMGFIFDSTQVTYNTLHMDTLGSSVYAISVGRFITDTPTTSAIRNVVPNTGDLIVFPNPSTRELYITLPENAIGQVFIYTVDGRMLFQQIVKSSLISPDTELWPSGTYIIQYKQEDGTTSSVKWIKQ